MASMEEDFKYPPGNWMARQLRLINTNSVGLLPPKTAKSKRGHKKYDTIYKMEFKDDSDLDHNDHQKHFEKKRETVQDILFSGGMDTAQMFMNWKIPTRILESPTKVDRQFLSTPSISQPSPDRLLRQSTLPEIQLLRNQGSQRPVTQGNARRTPSRALGTPACSARGFRERDSASAVWSTAVRATNNTKKNIETILRTNDYKTQITSKVRKSLEPDSKNLIDNWLDGATEEDRRMAIKLFSTLDNNNLPETEKQVRIEGIMKMLKSKHEVGRSIPDLNTRVRYLQLQEPETRAKRWMHTTWHHMPPYRDIDPVANTSSMYTKPHQPVPYDYVIHPDWG